MAEAQRVIGEYPRQVVLATAWRRALAWIAYIPLSSIEVRERFEELAGRVLDALLNDDAPQSLEAQGRAVGAALVELNLIRPEALEQTLSCLSAELHDVAPSHRLARLMAAIAGGFVEAAQAAVLSHQERVGRAALIALQQTQKELEASRDNYAAINRELVHEIAERTLAQQIQQEYAERLQNLHEVDLAILSAESLPAIADISIAYLQHIIPALNISINLIDRDSDRLIVLTSSSSSYPSGRTIPISMRADLSRLREGKIVYMPDLREFAINSPALKEIVDAGGRSLLTVPLRYRQETLGSVSIVLDEVREFSDKEMSVVQEIADSVTVAIQNRRLLEAEQDARQREATLREVAASLTLGLDQDELLRLVLEQLDRVIPSRSSSVILSADGNLTVAAQQGMPSSPESLELIVSRRPPTIWRVIEDGCPILLTDTKASPEWITIPGYEYIHSWIGVPLLVKGECIGMIAIDGIEAEMFSERDLDLAMIFANQVAVAIDNARSFAREQQLAEEMGRLERERSRELALLYDITVTAVSNAELGPLLERILELVIETLGGTAAAVYLVEGEKSDLHRAALIERQPHIADAICSLSAADPILLQPLLSNSMTTLTGPELPDGWPDDRPWALALMPLRSRDRALGVFCLVSDAPNSLNKSLLSTIADQIAVTVENIRLRLIARQSAIIEERERLAREIHDAVTQSIYSIALFADAALGAIEAGDLSKVKHRTQSILAMTDMALRELRLLLFELRTESLARLGLAGALEERMLLVESHTNIQAELRASNYPDLPVPIEETYYRVALEALNNSFRHARATRVEIDLAVEDGHLVMAIADDGVGFDPSASGRKKGMGLEGMRQRVSMIGGELSYDSRVGHGTRIRVRTPLLK